MPRILKTAVKLAGGLCLLGIACAHSGGSKLEPPLNPCPTEADFERLAELLPLSGCDVEFELEMDALMRRFAEATAVCLEAEANRAR